MTAGFHPLADRELTEAAAFYEARAAGLGSRFLDDADAALRVLGAHPALGRPLSATIRSLPFRRFPYSLVYEINAGRIVILAVAHQRRRPQYWTGRTS